MGYSTHLNKTHRWGTNLAMTSLLVTISSLPAMAGGFDRGGVKIDLLFDEKQYIMEGSVTTVRPNREIKNIKRGSNATNLPFIPGTRAPNKTSSRDVDGDYTIPSVGLKFDLYDDLSCLATYSRPIGGYANYGRNNAYSPSTVEFELKSDDYGLTCGYRMDVGETSLGNAQMRLIGGFSYMEVKGYQSRQSFLDWTPFGGVPNPYAAFPGQPAYLLNNPRGVGEFRLEDETWGWRAGVSYEIPDIALRAQVIYSSKYDLDGLSGTVDTRDFNGVYSGVYNVRAESEVPQAVEARFQSGINETTLLFASVKWQEWSELQSIEIDGVINPATGQQSDTSFDLYYRDGWTVTGGIGKKLTEELSGQLALTWDRGTSTVNGFQTDSWLLSGGVSADLADNTELVLGGMVGLLTSGESDAPKGGDAANNVSYEFDNDWVYALSAKLKVNF